MLSYCIKRGGMYKYHYVLKNYKKIYRLECKNKTSRCLVTRVLIWHIYSPVIFLLTVQQPRKDVAAGLAIYPSREWICVRPLGAGVC